MDNKNFNTEATDNSLLHFTEEMIPEPIRRWTVDSCLQTEGSLNYGAVSAIIVCSNLIGYRCQIKPKRHADWKVTPNLWGMLIGEPSLRKSPVADHFLNVLRKFELSAYDVSDQQLSIYKEEKMQRDIVEKVKKMTFQKALERSDTEEMVRAKEMHLPDIGKEPKAERYIINDASTEAIGEIMENNNRTIVQSRDELSGLFTSFLKPGKEGDRAFFLEAFQGDRSYTYDRIQRGVIHIKNLSIGVFGTIQPSVLAHYLLPKDGKNNDGLCQRMQLSVFSDDIFRTYTDLPIDVDARDSAYRILQKLSSANFETWGATKDTYSIDEIPFFSFSEEAQKLFIEWYNQMKTKERSEPNLNIQAHLGKYYSLLPALALTFFLIDKASEITISNAIDVEYIYMAEQWCIVLESHAKKMYALGESSSLGISLSEKIVNFAKEHSEKLPATFGSLAGDIRGASAEDVEMALKDVAEINGRTVVRLLSSVQLSNK